MRPGAAPTADPTPILEAPPERLPTHHADHRATPRRACRAHRPWLRWVQYICSLKYGINLILIAAYGPANTFDWPVEFQQAAAQLLENEQIDPESWWWYTLVLVAITVTFRSVALAVLSYRAKRMSAGM